MSVSSPINSSQPLFQPHIYFVPLDGALCAADYEAGLALNWLTDDEVAKVSRYRSESARNTGLQVRLALRAIMSLHSDLKPFEWRFSYGAKGKPALSEDLLVQTGLHFNLSHSGDWLMIGIVSNKQAYAAEIALSFGVDIERERSSTKIEAILNHYFSAVEIEDLMALPLELQRQRFFDLWALKEVFIKATGKGLAQSLTSFGFTFAANSVFEAVNEQYPTIAASDYIHFSALDYHEPQWQFYFGRLSPYYRFSVCIGDMQSQSLLQIKAPTMSIISLAQLIPSSHD
jgi:4'-phosphopantetheinyl transferase